MEDFPWNCSNCSPNISDSTLPSQGPDAESTRLQASTAANSNYNVVNTDISMDEVQSQQDDFNISLPFAVADQPVEESINHPLEIPEDEEVCYEVLPGASRRGGELLADTLGYTYVIRTTGKHKTTYICSQRNSKGCSAKVGFRDTVYIREGSDHTHAPEMAFATRAKLGRIIRKAARKDIFRHAGPIVDEALNHVPPGVQLPSVDNLKRAVHRARAGLRPSHPTAKDFELDMRHIPVDFLQRDIMHEGERFLIFATKKQLELLINAKLWFTDGTFKCSKEPFIQLYSIHCFVRSGDIMKQTPLCFILMTRRKKEDYKAVFRAIAALTPGRQVEEITADFEAAVWSAVCCVLKVPVKGCWFHWSQAIYRHIVDAGLRAAYKKPGEIQDYVRYMMALPHLPYEHIAGAFQQLKDRCPADERLVGLTHYIEKSWITHKRRKPESWSTFRRFLRTNNDCEGWHNHLNSELPHDHPNMYILIPFLHQEAEKIERTVQLVCQQVVQRQRTQEAKSKQAALEKLWDKYTSGQYSTFDYLKKCSKKRDHAEEAS